VERVTVEGATRLSLSISNPGPALAFFVQLRATDPEGADVLPATWSDNYISLMPGERRMVELALPWIRESSETVSIEARGINVPMKAPVAIPRP
jgi:hypothetical protein